MDANNAEIQGSTSKAGDEEKRTLPVCIGLRTLEILGLTLGLV